MSLRKRGSVWWIDIATPSGERVRRSTETGNKPQAQELHDKHFLRKHGRNAYYGQVKT